MAASLLTNSFVSTWQSSDREEGLNLGRREWVEKPTAMVYDSNLSKVVIMDKVWQSDLICSGLADPINWSHFARTSPKLSTFS